MYIEIPRYRYRLRSSGMVIVKTTKAYLKLTQQCKTLGAVNQDERYIAVVSFSNVMWRTCVE